jgi:mono/diheme cytochrome c family protein
MIRNVLPPLTLLAAITLPLFPSKADPPMQLKSLSVDIPAGDLMFPTGPGSDAANNNCLACHSAGMVLNQPALPQAQWRAEVEKMRLAYKAPVDEKDVDAIVNYLVSIRGTN